MKNKRHSILILLFSLLFFVCSCATIPSGPSVAVMPPPGKSFDAFRADDAVCRDWASQHIGQSAQEAANASTVKSAAVGTAVGAGLGAAIGAASGHMGTGLGIGAASGLLLGTLAGTNASEASGYTAQNRYDIAYQQCMYAKGNLLPGMTAPAARRYSAPPPPQDYEPNYQGNVPPDYNPNMHQDGEDAPNGGR